MSNLVAWLALVPLALAVLVLVLLVREQQRVTVEYVDARGRRRRVKL